MERTILLIYMLIFSISISAQSSSYKAAMKNALTIHDTASSVHSEIESLEAFEKITRDYPDEWLGHYWTAYILTQVARLETRVDEFPENLNPKDMIRKSLNYMKKAFDANKTKTDKELSDLHMLQGFVYGWMNYIVAESEEEKAKYDKIKEEEYKKAVKYNNKNPLYLVLTGIDLTSPDNPFNEIMAGIALLDYANEIFNKAPERSETTYWNKDFIGFWKSRALKTLEDKLN